MWQSAASNAKDLADYLENVKLVLDGDVLAEWKLNGKYLTFNLNNAYTIEKNKTVTFTYGVDKICVKDNNEENPVWRNIDV